MKVSVKTLLLMLAPAVMFAAMAGSSFEGCAAQKQDMLMQNVKDFNNNLRWKRYDHAAQYMPADMSEAFTETMEKDDENLSITDFEFKEIVASPDGNSLKVKVKIAWHKKNEGVEKKAVLTQNWKKGGTGTWYMASMEGEGPWKPELFKPSDKDKADGGGDDVGVKDDAGDDAGVKDGGGADAR